MTHLPRLAALLPCFFLFACDDPTVDEQTADMIEICEALDGDCDEAIEDYLAEVEATQDVPEDGTGVDGPDELQRPNTCTHCNDGPRDIFVAGDAEPAAARDPDARWSAHERPPTHEPIDAWTQGDYMPDPYPAPGPQHSTTLAD